MKHIRIVFLGILMLMSLNAMAQKPSYKNNRVSLGVLFPTGDDEGVGASNGTSIERIRIVGRLFRRYPLDYIPTESEMRQFRNDIHEVRFTSELVSYTCTTNPRNIRCTRNGDLSPIQRARLAVLLDRYKYIESKL